MVDASACTTVSRRFVGPVADELAILCRPERRSPQTVHQAEAAYRALAALLAAQQASFRDLASETLFLRDVRCELPLVLDVRQRVLADLGQDAGAPPPAFIQQAPVDQCASFELAASAVVPHDRDAWSVRNVRVSSSCACKGCARSGARLIIQPAGRTSQPVATQRGAAPPNPRRPQAQTSLYTTNVYGAGGDPAAQALDMFRTAERLLDQCGMGFRNVVRTWIYLRDISRDYATLNTVRRQFFRRCGIELRPASTGVQGVPFPDAHDFSMSLYAVQAPRPLDITSMSAPTLNEAWSYGGDFSRGVRVAEANKVALYVSGTASIDDAGRTVHVGNFEAQADRMLRNIASLLAQQGATFENVISAVTYLRDPSHVSVLRLMFRKRGFEGFPCALVEAPLCRPELLCEAEVVAMLRPAAGVRSMGRSPLGR